MMKNNVRALHLHGQERKEAPFTSRGEEGEEENREGGKRFASSCYYPTFVYFSYSKLFCKKKLNKGRGKGKNENGKN